MNPNSLQTLFVVLAALFQIFTILCGLTAYKFKKEAEDLKTYESSEVQKKLYIEAKEDRKIKHQEETALLKSISDDLFEIKSNKKEEYRKENLVKYEVDSLIRNDNLYYRAIKITNVNERFSQHNFTVEIKGDSDFAEIVNGPRPIGGGGIQYIPPQIKGNICRASIVELKPQETILIGLYSQQRWDLVSIRGHRN